MQFHALWFIEYHPFHSDPEQYAPPQRSDYHTIDVVPRYPTTTPSSIPPIANTYVQLLQS